ncbi:MAG: hypothetical protein GX854_00550 [Clostridiales bacterium]|nr:hypothetical protein [Clostridiales bacterium]
MSEEKNYPICGAKTKGSGEPCQRPAGWGTDHPGVGKCKLHGGASPVKHGLYSKYTSHRLADMVDKLSNDEELLDLRKTIALQQALILNILDQIKKGKLQLNEKLSRTLNDIADKLGRNIERRQKVEEGEKYILQVDEVQRIINQVILIIKEEVKDSEVVQRIGRRLKGVKY